MVARVERWRTKKHQMEGTELTLIQDIVVFVESIRRRRKVRDVPLEEVSQREAYRARPVNSRTRFRDGINQTERQYETFGGDTTTTCRPAPVVKEKAIFPPEKDKEVNHDNQ
jgi:hypothetical protein